MSFQANINNFIKGHVSISANINLQKLKSWLAKIYRIQESEVPVYLVDWTLVVSFVKVDLILHH